MMSHVSAFTPSGENVRLLSETLSVTASGKDVKFTRYSGEETSVNIFPARYWQFLLSNVDHLVKCVENGERTVVRHLDAGYSVLSGVPALVVAGDSRNPVVILRLETDMGTLFDCGVDLTGDEFSNLLCIRKNIQAELEGQREGCATYEAIPTCSVARAARWEVLQSALYMYRKPGGGGFSQWFLLKAMCVEHLRKKHPDVDPRDVEITEVPKTHGGFARVLECIVTGLLMYTSRLRATELCNGCPTFRAGRGDPYDVECAMDVTQRECDDGCCLSARDISERYWSEVKMSITADHVAAVCAQFLGMYGGGYNFCREDILLACTCVLAQCNPSVLDDEPNVFTEYNYSSFPSAAGFVQRLLLKGESKKDLLG